VSCFSARDRENTTNSRRHGRHFKLLEDSQRHTDSATPNTEHIKRTQNCNMFFRKQIKDLFFCTTLIFLSRSSLRHFQMTFCCNGPAAPRSVQGEFHSHAQMSSAGPVGYLSQYHTGISLLRVLSPSWPSCSAVTVVLRLRAIQPIGSYIWPRDRAAMQLLLNHYVDIIVVLRRYTAMQPFCKYLACIYTIFRDTHPLIGIYYHCPTTAYLPSP